MKIFAIIAALKYLLAIAAIVFLFIDWKIALAIFLISMVFHVVPQGPHMLFKTLIGSLIIGGLVYVFIDWRIGIVLFVASYLVTRFYAWGNKLNMEYYRNKENLTDPDTSTSSVESRQKTLATPHRSGTEPK